jgi:glutamate-5-semialdehyde dehydrogenase
MFAQRQPRETPLTDSGQWLSAAGLEARQASKSLSSLTGEQRVRGIRQIAASIRAEKELLLKSNAVDVSKYNGIRSLRERMTLTPDRLESLADSLEVVADLPVDVGQVLESWSRPNGLSIEKVSSAIGVIGLIFESRPAVGVEAAALTLKTANSLILRGGSDCWETLVAFQALVERALEQCDLPTKCVQLVPSSDRTYVAAMLQAAGSLDLIIPRGGRSLVERVQAESRVPVLSHADGLNHTFVHGSANFDMARTVVVNAKMRRPSVCGATETLLIDESISHDFLPLVANDLMGLGCVVRGDERARAIVPGLEIASEDDFATEWQDAVISVAIVDGNESAIAHVNDYGSGHTDAIIAEDAGAADEFIRGIDSAVTMWNASTQFSDGGEFGFGAEIGIATGRLHARGPVGPSQLMTFRYVVKGSGQVRSL